LDESQNLNIHYISQRGDTIDILTDLTCSFLYIHETNIDNYQVILVEFSAGINNLLHRENVLSDKSPQQFIANAIKQIVPSALVCFVTIPSANLFELHCSTQSLCVQQAEFSPYILHFPDLSQNLNQCWKET
jgi:hypothetical protein